jgi:hypothetical protein
VSSFRPFTYHEKWICGDHRVTMSASSARASAGLFPWHRESPSALPRQPNHSDRLNVVRCRQTAGWLILVIATMVSAVESGWRAKNVQNRQPPRMRERAQRPADPGQGTLTCGTFASDGLQHGIGMFNQRVRLWIISKPLSVTPGGDQAPRLKHTQINAGLVLGQPRLCGDLLDGNSRLVQHGSQAPQSALIHQRAARPPHGRMIDGPFTSHEMRTAYHARVRPSNDIAVNPLVMTCGYCTCLDSLNCPAIEIHLS